MLKPVLRIQYEVGVLCFIYIDTMSSIVVAGPSCSAGLLRLVPDVK
jgi:hypothetical protein